MSLFEWEPNDKLADDRIREFLNFIGRPIFNVMTHFYYVGLELGEELDPYHCEHATASGWCACHWRSPEEARESMEAFARFQAELRLG